MSDNTVLSASDHGLPDTSETQAAARSTAPDLARVSPNGDALNQPPPPGLTDLLDAGPASPQAVVAKKANSFEALLSGVSSRKPNALFYGGYAAVLDEVHGEDEHEFFGMTLRAPSGVYSPSPLGSSSFVARNWACAGLDAASLDAAIQAAAAQATALRAPEVELEAWLPKTLLEIGCGSGALSLFAARQGWLVTASDVNPDAVAAARENAQRNHIALDFSQSDLFEAHAGQKFDVILFNLPFLHKSNVAMHEIALSDTDGGVARRFLDQAHDHLAPNGRLVFTFSNCSDAALLDRPDWAFEVASCHYDNRLHYWLTLLIATPTNQRG